jgi:hypothetical protein
MPAATLIALPGLTPAESAPVVALADELQALLVEQEIGDLCSVITLKDPLESPGRPAAEAVKSAPVLLVVVPAGGIAADAWSQWEKRYPNARRLELPEGDTVFAARAAGADLRAWIMQALPEGTEGADQPAPAMAEGVHPAQIALGGCSGPGAGAVRGDQGLSPAQVRRA